VRHDGQAHVIHHWRQDWTYCGTSTGEAGYQYDGRGTWKKPDQAMLDRCRGNWQQLVYNVDDSPRYTSWGSWAHDDGVSTWTGDRTLRPLPLRENHLSEQYDYLASVNTHVVSDKGWLHLQLNNKVDADHPTQPVLSIERGINRYERIPDQNFEKAHEYWKNTAAYWREVRSVWNEVFADKQELILAEKWKGDAMFSHLFGLADEYWGQRDLSEARPRIGQIIDAFVIEPGDEQ